jgi:hypothetical protein
MTRMRRDRSLAPWYYRLHPLTWVLLGVLVVATASLALRAFRDASVGRPAPQVQVLNGSGVPELAQRAAAALRARGLDVVQVGNADSQNYAHTLVLQRRGHAGVARQVAGALGSGRVLQQLDATLQVDVTVVLGRDYAGDDAP